MTSSENYLSEANASSNGKNYGSIMWWQQPSKCSTDAATKTNGGGSETNALLVSAGNMNEYEPIKTSNKNKCKFALVTVLLVAGSFMAYFAVGKNKTSNNYDDGGVPSSRYDNHGGRHPFSTLHPVHDLGLKFFSRPKETRPPRALLSKGKMGDNDYDQENEEDIMESRSYPTNAWYQNMLLVRGEPTEVNRAYSTPFIVDAVGPIPGIRMIPGHIDASSSVVQMNVINSYGLVLGAAPNAKTHGHNSTSVISKEYVVENTTPLGFTLGWDKTFPMTSNIVKGMPFGTMKYDAMKFKSPDVHEILYPTVASENRLASAPIVDGKTQLNCTGYASKKTKHGHSIKVEREIELHFLESDFTWLVFVSHPVTVQCVEDSTTGGVQLQVIDTDDKNSNTEKKTSSKGEDDPFIMRIALAKFCTSNNNPIYCHHEQMIPYSLNVGQGRYDDLLRNHSQFMPGPDTDFEYAVDQNEGHIQIVFDWDVKDIKNYNAPPSITDDADIVNHDLITFALPHHLDLMGTRYAPGYLKYCATTLIGPACLLAGSRWTMMENLPVIGLRAPLPPAPWAIKALAESAQKDIHYTTSKFYSKGAGDTYFSGKMLAKLGRIVAVVDELRELCGQDAKKSHVSKEYRKVCDDVKLPNNGDFSKAVASLRSSVEIWLNGKAVTPFVFDNHWGGVVSCGCDNPDGGECRNKFPECPAFTDPGLNFGNAFYNDLHFHYGYHIYAAAVVSKFDPDWGKEFFERVLLLVRNIANPSYDGDYFPGFRHKDVYQGHSWASGVVPPYLNGRNQESSSEAIAAYEAVAVYGAVMKSVWEDERIGANVRVAKDVQEAGQLLTATELRSARRYYHVKDEGNANKALKIYPSEYTNHAIGMLWNTMAQYQTWFGGKPYLAAGIQLLPITPIAEQRDGVEWLSEMYPSFAKSCDKSCEEDGWSVLQLASLATLGHQEKAAKDAVALAPSVFKTAGGNGHSLTNTLWYIATRPVLGEPFHLGNATKEKSNDYETGDAVHELSHCFRPKSCTDYVLDTIADEYTCRQRMTDLMWKKGQSQEEACFTVAKIQFPKQCGACVPNATETSDDYAAQCPPCTVDQCRSSLNRCPSYSQTFVCTDGPNLGGCSEFPWDVRSPLCTGCCELTECIVKPQV